MFCTKQNPGDFAFSKSNFSSQYDSLRYYIMKKEKIESRENYFQREIVVLKVTNIVADLRTE